MAIGALACSPDRRIIASGSYDGTIQLRDAATGTLRATYQAPTRRVYALSWSRFGNLLAVAGDEECAVVCDALTGRSVCSFNCGTGAKCVSFSPRGHALATGNAGGVMQVWSLARPNEGAAAQNPLRLLGPRLRRAGLRARCGRRRG